MFIVCFHCLSLRKFECLPAADVLEIHLSGFSGAGAFEDVHDTCDPHTMFTRQRANPVLYFGKERENHPLPDP